MISISLFHLDLSISIFQYKLKINHPIYINHFLRIRHLINLYFHMKKRKEFNKCLYLWKMISSRNKTRIGAFTDIGQSLLTILKESRRFNEILDRIGSHV